MSDLWAVDENGEKYAEITKDELEKTVRRMQTLADEIERQAKRIAELEAECLLHWQACDTAWRANEIQAKRIAELEGVRKHAVHLLTGGGEEAVYCLWQALAATEQEGEK